MEGWSRPFPGLLAIDVPVLATGTVNERHYVCQTHEKTWWTIQQEMYGDCYYFTGVPCFSSSGSLVSFAPFSASGLSLSVTCLFASVVCCGSLVATLSWQWHFLCRSGGHCHQPQSCYGGEAGLLYPSFSVTCQPRRRPAKRPSLAWFPFPCLGPGCYPALHRGSVHHFKEGWGSLPSRAAPSRHIAIFALTDSQQVHGLGVDSVLSVWVECEGDCFLTYFRS